MIIREYISIYEHFSNYLKINSAEINMSNALAANRYK